MCMGAMSVKCTFIILVIQIVTAERKSDWVCVSHDNIIHQGVELFLHQNEFNVGFLVTKLNH